MTKSGENKAKFTISMDAELLRRLDRVAEAREDNRSEMIERIVHNAIAFEEQAVKLLLDNTILRETVVRLMESPRLLEVISKFVGDNISQEEVAATAENARRLRRVGQKRAASKREERETDQQGEPGLGGA